MSKFKFTLLISIFVLQGAGCAGLRPFEEFTLAKVALSSAKTAGAPAFAPGKWSQAEDHYRKGSKFFKNFENKDAKRELIKSRVFAERAENLTRLKKFMSGEGL